MVENMSAAFDVPSHSVQVSIVSRPIRAASLYGCGWSMSLCFDNYFITDT